MDDDWDLHAVVRGCTSTSANTASSSSTTITTATGGGFFCSFSSGTSDLASGHCFSSPVQDPFETRNCNFVIGELPGLYKPFFPKSSQIITTTTTTTSSNSTTSFYSPQAAPISPIIISKDQTHLKHQPFLHHSHKHESVTSSANSHTPRSKRRKNQQKKVCQVPAEGLSSDVWAWRKYGQKPIKGSPYPRGYYRCSSSKGCLARKQVERNRSDPGMFIVTYTGEHNHTAPTHRNSLAGSTRQKTATPTTPPQNVTTSDSNQPCSPAKPSSSSPATSVEDELLPEITNNTESRDDDIEKDALMDDDDDEEFVGFSDMPVGDDFFAGLDELASPTAGGGFTDHFSMNFGMPWIANSAATTAAGSL